MLYINTQQSSREPQSLDENRSSLIKRQEFLEDVGSTREGSTGRRLIRVLAADSIKSRETYLQRALGRCERRNPKKKWDRTMQYRLNRVKIKSELEAIGYQLEEWVFKNQLSPMDSTSGNSQLGSCELPDGSDNLQLGSGDLQEQYQNTSSKHLKEHTHNTAETGVGVSCKNAGTRTETTSKTTNETYHTHARHAARTNGSAGVRGRSKFSLEICLEFAEHLRRTGKGITNPGGYAVAIHRSGAADVMIKKHREQTEKCPSSNDPPHGAPSLTPEQVAEHAGLIGELLEGGYTHEQIETQFAASFRPEVWALIKEATVPVFTPREQEQV